MRILLAILTLLTAVTIAGASDGPTERETLRGLHTVFVSIEYFDERAQKAGFDAAQFKIEVELELRLAGVKVVEGDTPGRYSDGALLYVAINPIEVTPGVFTFSIDVSLEQAVNLARNGHRCLASTWSSSSTGGGPMRYVHEAVKGHVEKFVNAWLSVNPKK
jgi:hypothetical protein